MTSNAKSISRQRPIVVGRSTDGEIFSVRKSSAGAYRVMDSDSFSKAARQASKMLRKVEQKRGP